MSWSIALTLMGAYLATCVVFLCLAKKLLP